jgi:hypothetical protein
MQSHFIDIETKLKKKLKKRRVQGLVELTGSVNFTDGMFNRY